MRNNLLLKDKKNHDNININIKDNLNISWSRDRFRHQRYLKRAIFSDCLPVLNFQVCMALVAEGTISGRREICLLVDYDAFLNRYTS